MASSTAPVEPLPLAIKDLHDVEYHDAEKDGGIGHPVTGVNSGPNTIYIDPAAERKLVRKQVCSRSVSILSILQRLIYWHNRICLCFLL